jgi:hypothetical protein
MRYKMRKISGSQILFVAAMTVIFCYNYRLCHYKEVVGSIPKLALPTELCYLQKS